MDKLSYSVRYSFIKRMSLLLLSLVCFENVSAKSNVTTLFSSHDSFYRITLYRENYILPYHCLHQVIPPEPISVDWIQPIMNTRVEKRGNLDAQRGKKTVLTTRRGVSGMGSHRAVTSLARPTTVRSRNGTVRPNRANTIRRTQATLERQNSHYATERRKRREGMIFEADQLPHIPPTPDVKTPISPILRRQRSTPALQNQLSSPIAQHKHSSPIEQYKKKKPMLHQQRSFQGDYFDSKPVVRSPETYSRPFHSTDNTPIEKPPLPVLIEEDPMPAIIRTPISAPGYKQSPIEGRGWTLKMHMDTYVRLVSNAKKENTPKKEEEINKVLNKLVHVLADRPYYDYMVEEEVAFQISLKIPLFYIKNTDTRFYAAYTQRSWWQTKTSISAFFRETNFMPEFFVEQPFAIKPGWRPQLESLKVGGIHQSNGEGLEWERSWNRLFLEISVKCGPFNLILEPWWVLSTRDRATYNPDIEEHLGCWEAKLIYKGRFIECNLQKQKNSYQILGNIPLLPSLNLTFFYFSGKGSTLSLYKEHNSSWGIGIGARV